VENVLLDFIMISFHNVHNSNKCYIEFNMMVAFGLYWKSKFQINPYEISLSLLF
jgi:hypothetical protein